MTAVASVWMEAVVAAKEAVVALAAIATDVGMVRTELLLDKATVAPPETGWLRLTVHVAEEFEPRLVGLQVREETTTVLTRPTVALAELLL